MAPYINLAYIFFCYCILFDYKNQLKMLINEQYLFYEYKFQYTILLCLDLKYNETLYMLCWKHSHMF